MASTINPDAINPNIPPSGGALLSAPFRDNFAAVRAQFTAAVADVAALENAIAAIPAGPVGPEGPAGPAGATGATGAAGAAGANANIQFVDYGSNAATPRPDFPIVGWVGNSGVTPSFAIDGDLRFTVAP